MKFFLKLLARITVYASLLMFIAATWLIIFFSRGDRKIPPQVISYIESSIESLSSGIDLFVSSAQLRFLGFSEGFELKLTDAYINIGDNVVTSIPEMDAKIKMRDLLLFRIQLKEVVMERPQFVITTNESSSPLGSSFTGSFLSVYKDVVYNLFEAINKESNLIPVEKVVLNNSYFSYNNSGNFQNMMLKKATMEFYNLQNSTYLRTDVETKIADNQLGFSANAKLLDDDRMLLSFSFKKVPFDLFSGFLGGFSWVKNISPVLDGEGNVLMEKQGAATTISLKTGFSFHHEGFKDTNLTSQTEVDLIPDEQNFIKPLIKGSIGLKKLDMKRLGDIWPEEYASDIRADILSSNSEGLYKDINVNYKFRFEDLSFSKVKSEKYFVNGNVSKSRIVFNSRYPAIEGLSGFFSYDGNNLVVDAKKASIGKYKLNKTFAELSNINDPVSIIEVKGTGKGKIENLRPLLSAILRGRDKDYFYNTRKVSADSKMKFYYKDNVNSGFDPDILKLDIDADLTDVSVEKAIKGINVKADKANMKIDNHGMTISGDGIVNEASPINYKVFVGFDNENEYSINVDGDIREADLKNTITEFPEYVNGKTKATVEFKSLGQTQSIIVNADFKNADVNIPEISFSKKSGEFASLTLDGRYIEDKAIEIRNFKLIDAKSVSEGNAIISLSDSIADEIYFSKLSNANNNAELYYSTIRAPYGKTYYNKRNIRITGASFDATKLISDFKLGSETKTSTNLDVKLKRMVLKNDVVLSNVSGTMRCGYDDCYYGNFYSDIDTGGNLTISFKPDENKIKTFDLETSNMGRVLEGFGFKEAISKGQAKIIARKPADITDKNVITKGYVKVDDYKIRNAPVLARIFSLASFTGITEIFSGKGVAMKELTADFTLYNDYLSVERLISSGNSLGITTQGTIDLNKSYVDLSGAVTPSYSINSLFGKIPLLGKIFNAKEGEGLIATKYSVKGKYPDEVNVSVNPLSTLTPGVLREIWGRADTKIKE